MGTLKYMEKHLHLCGRARDRSGKQPAVGSLPGLGVADAPKTGKHESSTAPGQAQDPRPLRGNEGCGGGPDSEGGWEEGGTTCSGLPAVLPGVPEH